MVSDVSNRIGWLVATLTIVLNISKPVSSFVPISQSKISAIFPHSEANGISIARTPLQLLSDQDHELDKQQTKTLSFQSHESFLNSLKQASRGIAVLSTTLAFALTMNMNAAFADEIGVEREAPTLFTGESVMICVKRGPLGACLQTEQRTSENDNDKAAKYFKNSGASVIDRDYAKMEESELVAKLKQQSLDNKEKNDQIIKMKSLANDQAANFGPFDRQVVIMNADGASFTLLENPQAMRLKKMGYIKDRKFVTQPSKEVIDAALESQDPGFGEVFKGLFGSE